MLCPRCRAKIATGAAYCFHCGLPIALTCSRCGHQSPVDKRFCGDCGAPFDSLTEDAAAHTRITPGPERRQLTVMFADLVGSTALGNRLDPEDLRDVITSYQKCIATVAARFGGFVARYMGDGALIYFGFPIAREDDAERAVHTGLAITKATAELNTVAGPPGSLACRVGIATGSVVVGDVIGFGPSLEALVVGDTPNLAAGLTSMARPGMVVISEATRQLTRQLFHYVTLQPQALKGNSTPIQAWGVLAENTAGSRFESLRTTNYPLFGRVEELGLLMRRWDMAQKGEGCAALVIGEPGIGKSRLIAAFEEIVRPDPRARIRFLCSPLHQGSALYPFIKQIERAAAIQASDNPGEKLRKLRKLLEASNSSESDVRLVAELLSIPLPDSDATNEPDLQKDLALATLVRQFENLAREHPQLMVFEDIHWADPTTLELVELLIERLESLPLMLIATARPEFRPSWSTHPEVTYQLLGGLHRRDAASLIKAVAGTVPISDDLADRVIERADGIPLFIEELTKMVLEAAADRGEKQSHPGTTIPATLQDSLMARLDRSAAAKEICQIASVIGRDFSFEMLQRVSELPADKLEQGLQALINTGLATTRGERPHSAYTFKHALVQDVAYGSLLRERRRALHLRLAEVLEASTDLHAALPEVIAFHFAEADQADKAILYYLKAAARATGQFALTERAAYLRKALEQVPGLEGEARLRRELDIQIALYHTLVDEHGSSSDELGAAVERARLLCLELNNVDELIRVHDGLFNHHFSRSEPAILLRGAAEMLEIGQNTGKPQAHIMARKLSGFAHLLVGEFSTATEDMRELITLYDETRDGYGTLAVRDPKVGAYTVLGMCLTALGDAEAGSRYSFEAIRHAEALKHEVSQVVALRRACVQKMMQRDTQTVLELSDRLFALTKRFQTFKGLRDGTIFGSWARLQSNYDPHAMSSLLECIKDFDASRYWALLPFFIASTAEVVAKYERKDVASALLTRAGELVELTGERWAQAEIIRLKARFCASSFDEQRSLLLASSNLAKKQNARLWELRAAADLADLLVRHGDSGLSVGPLAPVPRVDGGAIPIALTANAADPTGSTFLETKTGFANPQQRGGLE